MKTLFERINNIKISSSRLQIHVFLWIIYIIYESVIVGLIVGRFSGIENYLIHYSINISVFYLHVLILDKLHIRNTFKDFVIIVPIVILEMSIYVLFIAIMNHTFTIYNQANEYNILGIDYTFVLKAFYRCLFFIIVGSGYWALKKYLHERKVNDELQRDKLYDIIEKEKVSKALISAENAFLRSQVNPHFLFNTLSFVHRRISELDLDSGEVILSLSKMMRYALDMEQDVDFSRLEEEIEQVENLINLFQIKENHSLMFHLEYDDSVLIEKIVPLTVLTLTENMFKHGYLKDPNSPAKISIRRDGSGINIFTENLVGNSSNYLSNKTGLINLKKRLSSTYKTNFSFSWELNGNIFLTHLQINLS